MVLRTASLKAEGAPTVVRTNTATKQAETDCKLLEDDALEVDLSTDAVVPGGRRCCAVPCGNKEKGGETCNGQRMSEPVFQ